MTDKKPDDFFHRYIQYCSGTEVPVFFDRWSAIVGLGAWLGKRVWIQHGNARIYPNIYAMLLGVPGTRKTRAVKNIKKLLTAAGYESFAKEKTSKEQFLIDLAGMGDEDENDKDFLTTPFGDEEAKEVFIASEEFEDFFSTDPLGFVATLGVLWDYEGIYKNKVKSSKEVKITEPTVSLLAANTQETFARIFPAETMGQGFFSRLLAIYAAPTGKQITWPKTPEAAETDTMVSFLQSIRGVCYGPVSVSPQALVLVDKAYKSWEPLDDIRFISYGNRRFTHLLKLILVHCCSRLATTIEPCDVVYANTILTHTERYMPKAFGAFGQARNSRLTHTVLQIIESKGIVELGEIWKLVQNDAANIGELGDIIRNLIQAERIQQANGKFLPKLEIYEEHNTDLLDFSYLTKEERHHGT